MSNGIGDLIVKAQGNPVSAKNGKGKKLELPVEELELELPEGDLFDLVDLNAAQKRADEMREQQELHEMQITDACQIATNLANKLGSMAHFFAAGNPAFVEAAKADANGPAMKAYTATAKFLTMHLKDGCVEQSGGKFRVGDKKSHCVISSRLSALREFSKLTQTRKASNGSELRGLHLVEIGAIAASVNAVVEVQKPTGIHIRLGSKFYELDLPGEDVEQGQLMEFERLVAGILADDHAADKIQRKIRYKSLREQADCATIEEALENGGLYLATVPDSRRESDGHLFYGGEILLNFAGNNVTIGFGDDSEFAGGHPFFMQAVTDIKEKGAKISFGDVRELMEKDVERPDGKREQPSYQLWSYVRLHIEWLFKFRAEMEQIAMMARAEDLSVDDFMDGNYGSIVLVLENFTIRHKDKKTPSTKVTPAALRVVYAEIEGVSSYRIEEASPGMMPVVGGLIGEDKVFPEDNEPKVLADFLRVWINLHTTETETKEPMATTE